MTYSRHDFTRHDDEDRRSDDALDFAISLFAIACEKYEQHSQSTRDQQQAERDRRGDDR